MSSSKTLLKPRPLQAGDCIGIFTSSTPAYCINEGLFRNGIANLERLGFRVKLGALTERRASQGYRSGSPQERAAELMELVCDDSIHGLISTIGGENSSSMIPYLDFEQIRAQRKLLCGYSDVTSLHLAIFHYARLQSLYGPALMTWLGEYPDGIAELEQSFLEAVGYTGSPCPRRLEAFSRWSNHFHRWNDGEWMHTPREWQENSGWRVLAQDSANSVTAPVIPANLDTLCSAVGTPYFPDLQGCILLIEEMDAPWARVERNLRQLQLIGSFDKIQGLIWSKPEAPDPQGAPFSLDELLLEMVGKRSYPVISNFDCGHTVPMHSIGLGQLLRIEMPIETPIKTRGSSQIQPIIELLEPLVAA